MKEEFETYRKIDGFIKNNLVEENPSCFNSKVSARKYKVTIELIEEPQEVIQARIQKLWDECTNMHHRDPLREEAEKYGLKL